MSKQLWTVEAYNPSAGWQKLPVTYASHNDALRGATCITFQYMVQTRIVQV